LTSGVLSAGSRIFRKTTVMKNIYLCLLLLMGFFTATYAQQSTTTTIILVRHAEKDTSAAGSTSMSADPDLSKAGKARAEKLVEALKDYKPDMIYTTNFKRTKATVTPLAVKFNLRLQRYDQEDQQSFANQLLRMNGKTVVVAGHSNTIPALANLLIKEERFQALDESVYNKIWIIRINNTAISASVIEY